MASSFGNQVQCKYVDLDDPEIGNYGPYVTEIWKKDLPLPVIWVNGYFYSAGDSQALGRLVQEVESKRRPKVGGFS
ncbi:MAG: hypothetical protein ACM3TT_09715 [Syntrophothermus sp.]